jgi:hypothetical protein
MIAEQSRSFDSDDYQVTDEQVLFRVHVDSKASRPTFRVASRVLLFDG